MHNVVQCLSNSTLLGLYMIGYKDTDMEGKISGGSSKNTSSASLYTTVEAEPQPEPEPVPVAQETEAEKAGANDETATGSQPEINEAEPAEDEKNFPIGAVAAGAGAAGGGAYGIRKLLLALGKRRKH